MEFTTNPEAYEMPAKRTPASKLDDETLIQIWNLSRDDRIAQGFNGNYLSACGKELHKRGLLTVNEFYRGTPISAPCAYCAPDESCAIHIGCE